MCSLSLFLFLFFLLLFPFSFSFFFSLFSFFSSLPFLHRFSLPQSPLCFPLLLIEKCNDLNSSTIPPQENVFFFFFFFFFLIVVCFLFLLSLFFFFSLYLLFLQASFLISSSSSVFLFFPQNLFQFFESFQKDLYLLKYPKRRLPFPFSEVFLCNKFDYFDASSVLWGREGITTRIVCSL